MPRYFVSAGAEWRSTAWVQLDDSAEYAFCVRKEDGRHSTTIDYTVAECARLSRDGYWKEVPYPPGTRFFVHTQGFGANVSHAELIPYAEDIYCVKRDGTREAEWSAHSLDAFLRGGHWREIEAHETPPYGQPRVRRFRHADQPNEPFNDGTLYVELPEGADEGYCVMDGGRHGGRHSRKWILGCVTRGIWVEIDAELKVLHSPTQESSVTRYFKHRCGFSRNIHHAELVNNTRLDAVLNDGTRWPDYWGHNLLTVYLREGWVEYFPDLDAHDLFIDQTSYETELLEQHTQRVERYNKWQTRLATARARLEQACFTDHHRRYRLRFCSRSNVIYQRAKYKHQGQSLARAIATFRKNPTLHNLQRVVDTTPSAQIIKDDKLRQLALKQKMSHGRLGGSWRVPPWQDASWYQDSEHYARHAHVSEDDPTKLAYTADLDKLERNIQTRIKPGRFLQRYFSNILSEQQIREWAQEWERINKPPEVHFIESDDPNGWERVYDHDSGFDSCMTGERCVRVYAYPGNGLRLAYMTDADDNTVARCIVVETSKTYVRVYGDDRLQGALEALGYRYQRYALDGVKIAKLEYYNCGWLMPFIDGKSRKHDGDYCAMCVTDHGDHLVVGQHGDYCADETCGYIEGGDYTTCDCCGERCDANDTYHAGYYDRTIGKCCIDEYDWAVVNHRGDTDWIHKDDVVEIDGTYYLEDDHLLHALNFEQCEQNGDWYRAEDMTFTSRGAYYDTRKLVELALSDDEGNDYAHHDDAKPAICVATGEEVYLHKDTDYDEEYVDPDTVEQLPLPTGRQSRPHDDRTQDAFATAA